MKAITFSKLLRAYVQRKTRESFDGFCDAVAAIGRCYARHVFVFCVAPALCCAGVLPKSAVACFFTQHVKHSFND